MSFDCPSPLFHQFSHASSRSSRSVRDVSLPRRRNVRFRYPRSMAIVDFPGSEVIVCFSLLPTMTMSSTLRVIVFVASGFTREMSRAMGGLLGRRRGLGDVPRLGGGHHRREDTRRDLDGHGSLADRPVPRGPGPGGLLLAMRLELRGGPECPRADVALMAGDHVRLR